MSRRHPAQHRPDPSGEGPLQGHQRPRRDAVVGQGGADESFSPVELLLVAIAGCGAIDVDFITAKRAEPTRFDVRMTGDKIRDEQGNRMTNLRLTFDVEFPDDEAGRAAYDVLPRAVQQSHDRLCTVSRTVEVGTPRSRR